MNLPEKILRIEVIGSPTDSTASHTSIIPVSSDTRAKTIQDDHGSLHIPEDCSSVTSDEYLVNYDSNIEHRGAARLTITEKKKLELSNSYQPDTVTLQPNPTTPGLAIHPEKLKYLENEGVIDKSDLERHIAESGSINESIPSNPELGFGILNLVSKNPLSKKSELDSGQAKMSPCANTQRARNDAMKTLPSKLKAPVTEASADYTAPTHTAETKGEEDCQYCAA